MNPSVIPTAAIPSTLAAHSQRKGVRNRLRSIGFGLVFCWVMIGPWPRGWVEEEWNSRRLDSALSQLAPSGSAQPERLLAGAAKVNLTEAIVCGTSSPASIPLAGYGKRVLGRGNAGVDDPVFARAIVLEQNGTLFSIVSLDLLTVSNRLVSRVMSRLAEHRLPLPRHQILFSATHTHSSYGSYGGKISENISLGLPDEEVCSRLADAVVAAIDQAWRLRTPADVSFTSRDLRDDYLCNNRTEKNGEVNEWLDVLSFRKPGQQQCIAHVVIFSAHATCRSSKDFRVSGDYPSCLCRRVEEEVGGECLFLAGGVGGMAPAGTDAPRETWSARIGGTLARHAVEMIQSRPTPRSEVVVQSVGGQLPIPQPIHKIDSYWRISPVLSGLVGQSSAWFQGMRIGNYVLIGCPADVGGVLASRWRKIVPGATTIAVSFNGDYIGYALPDEQYELGTYEPASMVLHGPHTGQVFTEAVLRLAHRLADR